jgi:hypothetical protein
MAKLQAPIYDGKVFTWNGLTAWVDASDLSGGSFKSKLFSDAEDKGFYIRSHRTGKVLMFTLVDELYESDEFTGWEFRCDRFKVIVAND